LSAGARASGFVPHRPHRARAERARGRPRRDRGRVAVRRTSRSGEPAIARARGSGTARAGVRVVARDLAIGGGRGMTYSVGIDVGGTYTDLASVGPDGIVEARKVLSTPADQSEGVAASLAALGRPAGEIRRVAHGTTVVTNLLLERKG